MVMNPKGKYPVKHTERYVNTLIRVYFLWKKALGNER